MALPRADFSFPRGTATRLLFLLLVAGSRLCCCFLLLFPAARLDCTRLGGLQCLVGGREILRPPGRSAAGWKQVGASREATVVGCRRLGQATDRNKRAGTGGDVD